MKLNRIIKMVCALAMVLSIGTAVVGCGKSAETENKPKHDAKTDMSDTERKDKKGDF